MDLGIIVQWSKANNSSVLSLNPKPLLSRCMSFFKLPNLTEMLLF